MSLADMDFNRPYRYGAARSGQDFYMYNALPLERPRIRFALNNNNGSSDSESDTQSPIELEQGEIERMDSAYARALQLRELRARNFDDNNMDLLVEPEWHEFLDDILMLDMMDPSDSDDPEDLSPPDLPTYPVGAQLNSTECVICCEIVTLTLRPCCDLPVCLECLCQYLTIQVNQANVRIECLSTECSSYIHRDEVLARLDQETKEKYYKFLVDANQDPRIKTCPRCSHVMTLNKEEGKHMKSLSKGLKVTCDDCNLVWCFPCQAPWHEGIQCKEFRKGDKLLRAWAREQRAGQHNAQRCPSCKVYIQRAAGCDHMICSRCKTNFCYRCGERFRHIKFIGDHYSRLSVFGCRYRFLPDRPVKRKLIRGAILGGKLLAAPVVAGLAVGGAALVLGFGTIAAPIYGGYKLHKRLKLRKERRRRRAGQNFGLRRNYHRPLDLTDYAIPMDFDEALRQEMLRRYEEVGSFLSETNSDLQVYLPISRFSENIRNRRGETSTESTAEVQLPSVSAKVAGDEARVEAGTSCLAPLVRKLSDAEESRRTLTTAQVVRQDSSLGDHENCDYPMEILNVVTCYAEDTKTQVEKGFKSTHKFDSTCATVTKTALKADSSAEATDSQMTCKTAVNTQLSSFKSPVSSVKGKSVSKNNGKALAVKEMDMNSSDADIATSNNNTSLKSHSKDGEGRSISHKPWLNIVCGKVSKEKEVTPKKVMVSEKCPSKGANKSCDTYSEVASVIKDENQSVIRENVNTKTNPNTSSEEFCSLEVEDGVCILESDRKPKDVVGAFGPESDEGEDDFSTSSDSSSPPSTSTLGYFCPAEDSLDFIDEEYVAQCSEMTCL